MRLETKFIWRGMDWEKSLHFFTVKRISTSRTHTNYHHSFIREVLKNTLKCLSYTKERSRWPSYTEDVRCQFYTKGMGRRFFIKDDVKRHFCTKDVKRHFYTKDVKRHFYTKDMRHHFYINGETCHHLCWINDILGIITSCKYKGKLQSTLANEWSFLRIRFGGF